MATTQKEMKFDTLLPLLRTNTSLIEDNLKIKLDKFAFSTEKNITKFSIKTPPTTPMVSTPSNFDSNQFQLPITPPYQDPIHSSPEIITVATEIPLFDKKKGQLFKGIQKQPIVLKLQHLNTKSKKKQFSSQLQAKTSKRRRHICKTCSMRFTTAGHLSRHNRIHTGEKNHTCPYDGCHQKFSRHDNCIQHYRTHLKKEKTTAIDTTL